VSTYAFTQGWDKERERLGSAEFLFDSSSTHRLADLGVTEGWQCLEVGFGAGSIALWLSDQVGSTGRVVATDLDPRFLDGHGRANLEVRTHDIAADPLEEAAFDVVHARLLLEWIPDWQQTLDRMISALRPGGWLVLENADWGGIMTPAVAHYTDPPVHAALYERILRASQDSLRATQFDANFGGRLPRRLIDAGLVNVAGEAHMPLVAGGTEKFVPGIVEFMADRLVATGLVTSSDIESFLALTADPSFRYAASLLATVWGQRPA
jgi:SAM-dependent methyltransferase